MPGTNLILLNRTDLDSGNDAAGSGSDPTVGGGAVVNVDEQARLAVTLFLGVADATRASTTETLDVVVEASDDGGSAWKTIGTFRQFLGSETPADTAAGDPPVKAAIEAYTPRAKANQNGVIKIRLNSTASNTNHWAPYSDIRTVQDVREEWLANAQIRTA